MKLPDLNAYCLDACVKLWGEPDHKTAKQLRWNGGDSYGWRTFDVRKRLWYDGDAKRGGGTLELAAYAKGEPDEKLRGKKVFECWQFAYEQKWVPDPAPPIANGGGKPILATYPYRDELGALLFEVVRFDSNLPEERFRQRQPDGKGGWIWNTKGVRRVLYRLPELIAAVKAGQRVLICEGEKDANTAVQLGHAATTTPGGVNKWLKDYDGFLHDAEFSSSSPTMISRRATRKPASRSFIPMASRCCPARTTPPS